LFGGVSLKYRPNMPPTESAQNECRLPPPRQAVGQALADAASWS
jgi:hypothetical protein